MEDNSIVGNSSSDTTHISDVEQRTQDYRLDVLQLCQDSHTKESWEVSQHFLDKCWVEGDGSSNSESVIYLCPECGAYLHPGWEGTSLRVARYTDIHAHRTRQRRRQRNKRRMMTLQQKKAKELAKQGSSKSTAFVKVVLRDDPDLLFDRHHFRLRCGRCATIIRLQGLKRELPPTKQAIQQKQQSNKGDVRVTRHDQRSSDPRSLRLEASPTTSDGDFLVLPPAPPKPQSKNHPHSNPSSWGLQNPKRGKKKEKVVGKSKLLNFLSSLND